MSPKVIPKQQRDALAMMGGIPTGTGASDNEWINRYVRADALQRRGTCTSASPYQPSCSHSYWKDLLLVAEADQRQKKATESVVLRGRDQGALDFSDVRHGLAEARERLRTTLIKDREARDLSVSSANEGLRPSLPGYLVETWARAARSSGALEAAFGVTPLEPGMVDTASNLPVVKIPRLSGGAAVAVQSADNAAVQEVDPTTASMSSPVSSVSGQVDMSRQLFEFSQPGFDMAITDDLSRAHAAAFDVEVINGTASAGRTRGLLSTSGILSVSGTVTSASTFLISLWQAFSAVAGSSGFGVSNTDEFVTILHPRRAAWLAAGSRHLILQQRHAPLLPEQQSMRIAAREVLCEEAAPALTLAIARALVQPRGAMEADREQLMPRERLHPLLRRQRHAQAVEKGQLDRFEFWSRRRQSPPPPVVCSPTVPASRVFWLCG